MENIKRYQRILVCTDFADPGMTALRRGADLAGCHGARLILLHVVERFPVDAPNDPIAPEDLDPENYYLQSARRKLQELVSGLGLADVALQVVMSTNSARDEIRRVAETERVDLIVLGSHGGAPRDPFGSTTMGVTFDLPCDVLVVNPGR